MLTGFLLLFAGLLLWAFPQLLQSLDKLPLNLYIKGKNIHFFLPLGACILLSAILSLLLWLIQKIIG